MPLNKESGQNVNPYANYWSRQRLPNGRISSALFDTKTFSKDHEPESAKAVEVYFHFSLNSAKSDLIKEKIAKVKSYLAEKKINILALKAAKKDARIEDL